jgi:hypothetical protein
MSHPRFLFSLLLAAMLLLPLGRAAAQQPTAAILSPASGAALQGAIDVTGSTPVEGFQFFEVTFAYANDPTGTWFFLTQGDRPVTNGLLVQWDTTRISDGDYTLRLLVTLQDGSQVEAFSSGVRVRNYTPIETPTPPPPTETPAPLPATATPAQPEAEASPPAASPTAPAPAPATLPPTRLPPTPLPPNPAELTQAQIWLSLGQGALVVLGLFLLGLAYTILRSLGRRS